MSLIKSIVIDDDPVIRHLVSGFIEQTEDIELIEAFSSPEDAIDSGILSTVDLIFLDMEMPKMNGDEFLNSINYSNYLVMMTAHSNYAHLGFEKDAVDFLLKPFDLTRFQNSVEKVKRRKIADAHQENFLFIKKDKQFVKIPFEDILYIQSAQEYVHVYTPKERLITYSNMKDILSKLDGRFLQIHRSNIVNLDKIQAYDKQHVKINGVELNVSRSYANKLKENVKING